jgi:DNA-directed RNA polymerase subunit RPC12/RpoP
MNSSSSSAGKTGGGAGGGGGAAGAAAGGEGGAVPHVGAPVAPLPVALASVPRARSGSVASGRSRSNSQAKPEQLHYLCGHCDGKVVLRLLRPEKVACTNCGSRMLYKTRPSSQLKEISTD